jgi:hypothetical protein
MKKQLQSKHSQWVKIYKLDISVCCSILTQDRRNLPSLWYWNPTEIENIKDEFQNLFQNWMFHTVIVFVDIAIMLFFLFVWNMMFQGLEPLFVFG